MWLHRKLKKDSSFPRPSYINRLMFFRVAELDAWAEGQQG
jgi:hypothetical protein